MSLATLPYNRYSIARYYPLFNVIISKLSCRSNKSLLICNVVGLSLCFLGTNLHKNSIYKPVEIKNQIPFPRVFAKMRI